MINSSVNIINCATSLKKKKKEIEKEIEVEQIGFGWGEFVV